MANPYDKLLDVKEYLYDAWFKELDYSYAKHWFEEGNSYDKIIPGCSSIVKNGQLGRNLD